MDMSLALIANLHDVSVAEELARSVELEWHQDPAWDPFALSG
jgi:hypothetical protein